MKKLVSFISTLLLLTCCNKSADNQNSSQNQCVSTPDSILRVATISRSTSYYTLRGGHEMGYDYELSKGLAEKMGKRLEIKVAKSNEELISMLGDSADVLAFPVVINKANKEKMDFVDKETITHQVIVQKKRKSNKQKQDVLDLIGKKITVVQGSKYHHRLLNLNDEIGGGMEINAVSTDYDEEALIKMVSKGEIEMTVCDNDIAQLQRRYYRNLDIHLEVSHPQRNAWAVAKNDSALLKEINSYFSDNEKSINKLYTKYYEPKVAKDVKKDVPIFIDDKHISVYDSIFKKQADSTIWDWRLLSAIAYTESRFNPNAGSFAGAKGLMQLMTETMLALGADPKTMLEPEENLRLGIEYLNRTYQLMQSARTNDDRIRLTLAAYNAGLGHIRDAQTLCELHGENPAEWKVVKRYVRLLASPDYYNLPSVKCGYLRGSETADYVDDIMDLYATYRRKFKK